jgi:hypothetical protein
MPNVSRVQGLRLAKSFTGPANGNLESFAVLASDATALYTGDIVQSAGTADASGVQAVTRLTANTQVPIGVIAGFQPLYENLNQPAGYRAASTARTAFLVVDPSVVFEVQATAATVLADIGLNVGVTFTAGSATTGQSGMVADMATKAVTATLPLKIVGVVQRPDQDMADSANWKLLVTLNVNAFGGNQVGV